MRLWDFVSMDKVLKEDYDIVTLFFDPYTNTISDEDGYNYASNIFNFISPNDLYLLKALKEPVYIIDHKDELWYEIIYEH